MTVLVDKIDYIAGIHVFTVRILISEP